MAHGLSSTFKDIWCTLCALKIEFTGIVCLKRPLFELTNLYLISISILISKGKDL